MTLGLYAVVRLNGLKRWTLGEPVAVMVKAFVLLSIKRLDWQVSSDVPLAPWLVVVNTVVGGVKIVAPTVVLLVW